MKVGPYYRIGYDSGEIKIICLQWFDEEHYRQGGMIWLSEKQFAVREMADAFLIDAFANKRGLPVGVESALGRYIASNEHIPENCLDKGIDRP